MVKKKESDESLKGWPAIAKFLSQPVSTAQRWAGEGMPVTRIGRYVAATPADLERWLTREAGAKEPIHIPSAKTDLLAESEAGRFRGSQDSSQIGLWSTNSKHIRWGWQVLSVIASLSRLQVLQAS